MPSRPRHGQGRASGPDGDPDLLILGAAPLLFAQRGPALVGEPPLDRAFRGFRPFPWPGWRRDRLRGGQAVLPWGIEPLDIGVRDGRIAAMGGLAKAEAAQVIDCTHLHVLPGLIDAHVHLREPGDPKVETIETGTKAAILGGLLSISSSAGDLLKFSIDDSPLIAAAVVATAVPVPQAATFSAPRTIPKGAGMLLLAGIFSGIVAFNLAFFRHLRREYASPRRGAVEERPGSAGSP